MRIVFFIIILYLIHTFFSSCNFNKTISGYVKSLKIIIFADILTELVYEVQEMKKKVDLLVSTSDLKYKSNDTFTKEKLCRKYDLTVPIVSLDDFHQIDELIKTDDTFKTCLVSRT